MQTHPRFVQCGTGFKQADLSGYHALYALLNSGKLKGYHNGRTWRIPKAALKEYILENSKIKANS
ncbi:MAG: helix-turn-helix domain-containing protein [Ruminococcaceae bacterium]|nr:helix-turn-helix domain-containing protein [Oscillospiraceae bacterium]